MLSLFSFKDRRVEVILDEANKLNIDLIVVGSHGHGAVYHLMVGSVSQGVLHQSTCPVLVVPTHDRTEKNRNNKMSNKLKILLCSDDDGVMVKTDKIRGQ